jgi:Gpi18-like mannosyltransferase
MIRLRHALTTDPRDNKSLILVLGTAAFLILALILRLKLTSFVDGDYTQYLGPWFDHLQKSGIQGFGERFSNYNFPYLFFIYLSTLLPFPKIVALKLIAIFFDFVLALAIFLIVREITGDKVKAAITGTLSLFLPTIFLNSGMWGQSDSVYVTFTLLSLYCVLIHRIALSWIMFGVALAFKLQAIFFLPVLAYVWMQKQGRWYAPLVVVPTFILLSIPPVFFGRSLADTLLVYNDQYGAYPLLTVSAPNLYFWIPERQFYLFNGPAVLWTMATVGVLLQFCILRVRLTPRHLVVMSALFLLIAPFLLPQMHERYFYGFEVLCLIIAALDGDKIWIVVVSQFVAFFSYASFLFDVRIIPWPFLSMIMLVLVAYFFHLISRCSDSRSVA